MKRFNFENYDVHVGLKLICIGISNNRGALHPSGYYTLFNEYCIIGEYGGLARYPFSMSTDNPRQNRVVSKQTLMEWPLFMPADIFYSLPEKELFIFKLSGKMPESLDKLCVEI